MHKQITRVVSNMNKTEQLRQAFVSSRSISCQMPIMFPPDLSWQSITCQCGKCGEDIPDNCLRGTLTSLIETVITMNAVAHCRKCLLLHHVTYRFRSDGAVEFIDKEGRWVRTYGQSDNWHEPMIERLCRSGRNIWNAVWK